MNRALIFLIVLFSISCAYSQSGVWGLPESYISRNNIKAVIYFNSDSIQTSRILFTKNGLVKEHAQFVKYDSSRDSILQVHAYEYDSNKAVVAHSYFQYSIGSNEFPLISNALHNPHYKNDSVKISRYASAYGHFYKYSEYQKRIDYPLFLNDSIDFHGEDLVEREVFESDSIVFRDKEAIWCFKYENSKLTGYWVFMIRNGEQQLYGRIWFNESGLPEKEVVYTMENPKSFKIVVEKWN